ncbi:hypothetical protein [Spiroplasma endosymbiont of Lariophagus distinguendus]|uniref:hypothetical protein n=1 Tax=Spiroplasma endosymbiont of Lariophagus distinguendus TaxID=2935082 RepID=UPI00207AF8BF|nr:hypothetical protein [Spiroplasma endosymbiont of Lariophagus distinguendus]
MLVIDNKDNKFCFKINIIKTSNKIRQKYNIKKEIRTSPHMYLWRKQWNWMSSTILFKQNKIVWNI